MSTILEVQPRMASSGGGKTNDEIVYDLAESILHKIPEKLDLDKALPEMFEVYIILCRNLYNTHSGLYCVQYSILSEVFPIIVVHGTKTIR